MNKIGIALSGGGARGIAHIGVLQALEEEGIFPTHIAGTSAGSLVGVLYAAGVAPKKILAIARTTSLFKLFRLQLSLGLIDLSQVKNILSENIKEDSFTALQKELFICITNIEKGKWEIRSEGQLFQPVIASCSIPFLFKPVEIEGQMYVDGGVLNNLPVEPLKEVCDKVIGVSVIPIHHRTNLDGMIEIAERAIDLMINDSSKVRLAKCDVGLEIEHVDRFGVFDFNKADSIFQLGYETTKSKMKTIKAQLNISDKA